MFSDETLLSDPYVILPLTVHTDASDKQLGSNISKNNKPIAYFQRILSKLQRNYTTTLKKLLVIVKFLKYF